MQRHGRGLDLRRDAVPPGVAGVVPHDLADDFNEAPGLPGPEETAYGLFSRWHGSGLGAHGPVVVQNTLSSFKNLSTTTGNVTHAALNSGAGDPGRRDCRGGLRLDVKSVPSTASARSCSCPSRMGGGVGCDADGVA